MADVTAVLGSDQAAFEALLEKLMSPTNEERDRAEAVFEECKQHPDHIVTKLAQTLSSSPRIELRGLAAVLLRKIITKDDVSLWPQLGPATQAGLKLQLLQCVQQEQVKSILKKLCDTVAELASGLLEEGQWPELLPFMFQCVSSPSGLLQESALLIFGQLAQYIGPTLRPYLATLHGVLHKCLASGSGPDVRIAALRATAAFIQTLEPGPELDGFQDLLPGMMQTLSLALEAKEEGAAQAALELFIEVAGSEPRFLRRRLGDVVGAMLGIAEARELEEATRHLAVEFLVTLAEAREQAPGMMRKLPHFAGRLLAALMGMLLEVEDDATWHTLESEEADEGESPDYEVAQEALDRLAIALGGNSVLPAASPSLAAFAADADWRKRHAALITLAQIAEGCAKVMVKSLEPVVDMILNSFADAHPRVRWAAINAIGQLSTDLGPELQQQFHARVVPALVSAMDDFNNPRVQAHAAAAVLNFSESASAEIMKDYLDGVVSKLLVLLQTGKRLVQEGALTALAAVADCAQEQFERYYDVVMPYLKAILMNARDKELRMLRAKSMECISLVGMAVGKAKFRDDAKQVMDVLVALQGADMEDDDPLVSYMLQAWARLCKCLGAEFLPYMPVVMPALLRSAQLKPDVTITDADSDDGNDDEDSDSVETITVGDKKIGIRTSVLEEKATACNMLCCYADELKEGFFPWIDQVAPIMVPLLKFYFHEEVRKAAVTAMPDLLRAGKLAVEKGVAGGRDQSYVKQLADYLVPPLVEALRKEPEMEIQATMLDALNECLEVAGELLDSTRAASIFYELKAALEASRTRKDERMQRGRAEEFDEEDREVLEAENEAEDEVCEQAAECLGTLAKTYKEGFEPLFRELAPIVLAMLDQSRPPVERRVGICIFDDMVENLGETAARYYPQFLPVVLEACSSSQPDIRQAALYGIGVCAEHGAASFRPYVGEALRCLMSAVGAGDARSPDNEMATDNAVAALGKLIEFQRPAFDAAQMAPTWLAYLPLRNDLVEAELVHARLTAMLERSDAVILGPNSANLPRIVVVLAEVLGSETKLASEETVARITNLLRHLQRTLPPDILAGTWALLQPQHQSTLRMHLASTA